MKNWLAWGLVCAIVMAGLLTAPTVAQFNQPLLSTPAAGGGCTMPPHRTPGHSVFGSSTPVNSATLTLPAAATAGDLIVIYVIWYSANSPTNAVPISGVTDNGTTGAYTLLDSDVLVTSAASYWAKPTGGPTTVTVTWGGIGVEFQQIFSDEFGTMATVAANAHNRQTNPGIGADAVTSTVKTVNACDLIWSGSMTGGGISSPYMVAGTSFTLSQQDITTGSWAGSTEYRQPAAAGSYAGTWTNGQTGANLLNLTFMAVLR